MSERNSRYWIEVRLSVAVRRALTTGVLPKDVAQDLDAAWGELEDYHYDRLSNDSDEGACGRCCRVGEHADEDCPEAPETDGETDDEPEGILTQRYYAEASDEARAVAVDQAHGEARRVKEFTRWVPRVTGLHPVKDAAMVWQVADDTAALERVARVGYASTEGAIADLIRRACR